MHQLTLDELNIITAKAGDLIWCGDFNAHNLLWGGLCTDININGGVVEEFMEEKGFKLCRVNIRDVSTSCLDLTIVPGAKWEVLDQSVLGSDYFPIRMEHL